MFLVTVYFRGPTKGYIESYYKYYPTVTEGGSTQGVGFQGFRERYIRVEAPDVCECGLSLFSVLRERVQHQQRVRLDSADINNRLLGMGVPKIIDSRFMAFLQGVLFHTGAPRNPEP